MEKQFLRNLLENAKEFEPKSFTIENLAEYFNVSKTSVHRFTQKLGYDSLSISEMISLEKMTRMKRKKNGMTNT